MGATTGSVGHGVSRAFWDSFCLSVFFSSFIILRSSDLSKWDVTIGTLMGSVLDNEITLEDCFPVLSFPYPGELLAGRHLPRGKGSCRCV